MVGTRADGYHVVQFYRRDGDLLGPVATYLRAALLEGKAAVVIATPPHRAGLRSLLQREGIVAGASLEVHDAADVLASFMVDGAPDATRFRSVIGGIMGRAGEQRRVVVYGEMVGLLWEGGHITGAIALEELWNGLAERMPFSLYCSYPAVIGQGSDDADAFADVCHLHSAVVGGAPAAGEAEVSRRFPATPAAARAARLFVTNVLERWRRHELVDDGALVAAELASNAVLHGASDFTVSLSRRGSTIRVVVGDTSVAVPRPAELSRTAVGGRGLRLVAAVATRWGHKMVDGGKLVWAELGGGPGL